MSWCLLYFAFMNFRVVRKGMIYHPHDIIILGFSLYESLDFGSRIKVCE